MSKKKTRAIKTKYIKHTGREANYDFARWCILAIVAVIPLISSVSYTGDPWDIWKVTALRMLVVAALAGWILTNLHSEKITILRSKTDIPLIMLLMIGFISSLLAHDKIVSFFGQYLRYEGWTTWLCYVLVFWLTSQIFNDDLWIARLINTWLGIAAIMAGYGVLQHFGLDFRTWEKTGPFEVFRSFGTIGNPLGFSAYLALSLPLSLYKVIEEKSKEDKFLFFAIAATIIAGIFFSFSRAGWIAVVVSMLAFIPAMLLDIDRSKRWLILGAGLAAFIAIITLLGLMPSGVQGRSALEHGVNIFSDITGGSSASRLHLWGLTIKAILQHPLLGYGYDTYKELSTRFLDLQQFRLEPNTVYDRPHSNILQVAFSTGLIGLFAYLWFIAAVLAVWISSIREKSRNGILISALAAGCIAYLIAVQFGFTVVSTAPSFWMAAGIMIALANAESINPKAEVEISFKQSRANMIKNTTVVITVFMIIISMPPLIADMYYRQGRTYENQESAAKAVTDLDKAIAFYPYVSDYYDVKAKTLYSLASLKEGGIDKNLAGLAIKSFELSANKGSVNLQAYSGIAEIYFNLGEYRKAEEYASRALREYRFSKGSASVLARALVKQGKYKDAEKEWHFLLNLDPNDVETYINLGATEYLLGNHAQASKAINKALELDPKNEEAIRISNLLNSKKRD